MITRNTNGSTYAYGNELEEVIGKLGPKAEGFGEPAIDPNTGNPHPLANLVQLRAYITVPDYVDTHILVVTIMSFDKNGVEQKAKILAAPILKNVIMANNNPILLQDAIGTIEILNVLKDVIQHFNPLPLYIELTCWGNDLIEKITSTLTYDCTEVAKAQGENI